MAMEHEERRPCKRREDSLTETVHVVMHADANPGGRIFGGRLMEWIDMVGGISAIRHCGGSVTTACVDNLNFMAPAYVGDIVVMRAFVTFVGRSSCEVRVETNVENVATGERTLINTAYLTEVHVTHEGLVAPIPFGLALDDPDVRREWELALRRREIRGIRRSSGV
ncbi:acyl-CoA thioesterase [Olsenella sp. HMSC062G07]|uniref:acyl-CoA thioesterase n=1 Tax=Olsenella sp. HMSC062G07 TaxID=1739330 RepID=UPI0008A1E058|nr:acyl-CoA thioesterase [Olsenella sp. HMSC062G07]